MEKELAARAGIGWMGKNTCTINQKIGSWLLLGQVVTTLDLPADRPAADRCGTCTRCIDACPTQAITAPYQLDARRCIAYLTIEHRTAIDGGLKSKIGPWLFGCDICQDVSSVQQVAPAATNPALQPCFATGSLDVRDVLGWTSDDYTKTLRHSAIKRIKLPVCTVQRPHRRGQWGFDAMANSHSIVAIVGPTASGKSQLALAMARARGAEILSVDSMQIYRGMDIGTAKPTPQQQTDIPHHLLDVVEPSELFSVAKFVELADAAIAGAQARGVPLLGRGRHTALFQGPFSGALFRARSR